MWIGLGGTAPLLYNLPWVRPLRPVRYMLSRLQERAAFPLPLTLAARPLGALAEVLGARLRPNQFLREQAELAGDALDPTPMLAHLPDASDPTPLHPPYAPHPLA